MIRLTAFPSDMNLEQGRNPHLGYFWENGTKRNEINLLSIKFESIIQESLKKINTIMNFFFLMVRLCTFISTDIQGTPLRVPNMEKAELTTTLFL